MLFFLISIIYMYCSNTSTSKNIRCSLAPGLEFSFHLSTALNIQALHCMCTRRTSLAGLGSFDFRSKVGHMVKTNVVCSR